MDLQDGLILKWEAWAAIGSLLTAIVAAYTSWQAFQFASGAKLRAKEVGQVLFSMEVSALVWTFHEFHESGAEQLLLKGEWPNERHKASLRIPLITKYATEIELPLDISKRLAALIPATLYVQQLLAELPSVPEAHRPGAARTIILLAELGKEHASELHKMLNAVPLWKRLWLRLKRMFKKRSVSNTPPDTPVLVSNK